MNKIGLALFIFGFWLFLPIPLLFFNVDGIQQVELSDVPENPSFLNFLGTLGNLFFNYWSLFFYSFPGSAPYLNYLLIFIKASTILFGILMLRGN